MIEHLDMKKAAYPNSSRNANALKQGDGIREMQGKMTMTDLRLQVGIDHEEVCGSRAWLDRPHSQESFGTMGVQNSSSMARARVQLANGRQG